MCLCEYKFLLAKCIEEHIHSSIKEQISLSKAPGSNMKYCKAYLIILNLKTAHVVLETSGPRPNIYTWLKKKNEQ